MACQSNSNFLKTDFEKKELPVKSTINDFWKTFEIIKDHSRTFGILSISKTIQESSESLQDQISFEDHRRDQRSFKELPTFFMIEDQSRVLKIFDVKDIVKIFENSSRSNIVRGCLDNRDRRPFNDLLEVFAIKEHSTIFGSFLGQIPSQDFRDQIKFRKSRSKIIQGPSQDVPDQIFFKDLKINQGPSEDLRDQLSIKNLRKILEIKDHSRIFGEDLPYHRSVKDLRKIFDIKGLSRTKKFGRIFKSKIFRKIFEIKHHSRSFR